jgi:hypothetical protein
MAGGIFGSHAPKLWVRATTGCDSALNIISYFSRFQSGDDMPLPEVLRGNRWTETTARRMFPLLVWCAKQGKKISVGVVASSR